jgi:hypothetical protein
MSFFDDEEVPKSKKTHKPYVPEDQRVRVNNSVDPNISENTRRRRAREKEKLKKIEQVKPERVYPPLMIRARANEE